MVSQFEDQNKHQSRITIPIVPPFFKEQKQAVNDLGLPFKDYYMTKDICKVLKLRPYTLRSRFRRGHYPEPERIKGKRIFTLKEVIEIIELSKSLFINNN